MSSPGLLSRRNFIHKAYQEVRSERFSALETYLQTFLKRGKGVLAACWYVALPFDFVRMRTKLVGFLLHPIARSATWRRLMARWIKTRWAFAPSIPFPGLWRETVLREQRTWRRVDY
jgi:hypothetical protein